VKLWRSVPVLIAVALGMTACGSSDSNDDTQAGGSTATQAAAKTTKPVVIGFAGGTTGFLNFYDGPVKAGAQVAIDEVNAKGGVAGRMLKMISADNKSDTSQIVPAALDVLDKGADILMPTCDYDLGGPAARAAVKQGKLAIGCAGGPLYGRQGIGPLLFNTMSGTPTEAAAMATFAKSKGLAKPYLLKDTTLEYSKTICSYFAESWKAGGGTLAGQDTFQNNDTSLSSQITRMKSAKADSIVLCSYPPGGAAAVKAIRAAGIDAAILGPNAMDGTYWLKAIPHLSNFYNVGYGTVSGEDPDPARAAFFKKFEQATGNPPATSVYPIMGYAAIQAVAKALQLTKGDSSGEALEKALETFKDEPLLSGPTTYTSSCHIPLGRPMQVVEIQKGKASLVGDVTPANLPKSPC
jgi:branched-chain amino acid transport system substrate-binding protein